MSILVGSAFTDPGYYTYTDGILIDNDSRVVVSSTLNNKQAGVYQITYKFYINEQLQETKIRKVTVTDKVTDFAYTGAEQAYIVPASGYYKIELWGASGRK